jgi:hypothetical protein
LELGVKIGISAGRVVVPLKQVFAAHFLDQVSFIDQASIQRIWNCRCDGAAKSSVNIAAVEADDRLVSLVLLDQF